MSSNPIAAAEYARVMATRGGERVQGLVKLSQLFSDYAPIWASLAEEHWVARRREEALQAARRALKIDPSLHSGFNLELKMASRPLLAQVAPPKSPRVANAPASAEPEAARQPAASVAHPLLATALGLRDREERLAFLLDLEPLAPEDAELLFHVAKELAVANRMDDARDRGERLRQLDPERYAALYAWADQHLGAARAQAEAERAKRPARAAPPSGPAEPPRQSAPPSGPASPPSRPASPRQPAPSERLPTTVAPAYLAPQRAIAAEQPGVAAAPAHKTDDAATLDVSLETADRALADEDVTSRASIDTLRGQMVGDGDNETVRLHLSELERLVAVSVDPKLDS